MPRAKVSKKAVVPNVETIKNEEETPALSNGVEKMKSKTRGKKENPENKIKENGKVHSGRSNKKAKTSETVEEPSMPVEETAQLIKGKARSAKKKVESLEAQTENEAVVETTDPKKGRGKKITEEVKESVKEPKKTIAKHSNKENGISTVTVVVPKEKVQRGVKKLEAEKIQTKPNTLAAGRGRNRKVEVTVEPEKLTETKENKLRPVRNGRGKRAATDEPTGEIASIPTKKEAVKTKKSKKTDSKLDENAVVERKEKPNTSKTEAKKTVNRKRGAAKVENDEEDKEADSKPSKSKKPLLNPTQTSYNKADFELAVDVNSSNTSNSGVERSVLKISSWNVSGLRSWLKKDGLKFLEYEEPDIFCLQEIKCTTDQMPEEVQRIPGYHPYWLCLPGGYAGVALYSKIMPINVEYGIGDSKFDGAGRLITAEYEKFFLLNVYVLNSGRKLVNLEERMRWEKLFQDYVKKLDARKPVIICGDMNVSHQEIDLANPKSNTRSAGFTIEEREKMSELLSLGFLDTFRHLYPDRIGAYTYWTYMANARARNVGWRLDYFIVSERIGKRVIEHAIRSQVLGSDHCPITLFINI